VFLTSHRLKQRFSFKTLASDYIIEGNIPPLNIEPYQFGLILILMRDISQIKETQEKILKMSKEIPNVIFVLSLEPLETDTWETIQEYMKYAELLRRSNKTKDAEYYMHEIESLINDWISEISGGRFYIIFRTKDEEEPKEYPKVQKKDNVIKILDQAVKKVFKYGLDNIILNDNLWKPVGKPEKPLKTALRNLKELNRGQYKEIYRKFIIGDEIIDEEGNFTESCRINPTHPLCMMKREIESFCKDKELISLNDIWEILQAPPFGLYSSQLGAVIVGILMKEYSKGYYITDGILPAKEVTPSELADALLEVIAQGSNKTKEWYLQKLSPEEEKFLQYMVDIFSLPDEDKSSVKSSIIDLRKKINTLYRYPLWILDYLDLESKKQNELLYIHLFYGEEAFGIIQKAINLIDKIIKSVDVEEKGRIQTLEKTKELIREFYKLIEKGENIEKEVHLKNALTNIIKPEYFREGFENLARQIFYADSNVSEAIIPLDKLDKKLRERLQEEAWAWEKDKVIKLLETLRYETHLSKSISEIFGIRDGVFLEEITNKLKQMIINETNTKYFPLWMYMYHPLAKENSIIQELLDIVEQLLFIENMLELSSYITPPIETILKNIHLKKDILVDIIKTPEKAIINWVATELSEEIGVEEAEEIREYLKSQITQNEKYLKEDQCRILIGEFLEELEITKLKNEIREKLNPIIGNNNILKYLREKLIPVSLMNYLPNSSSWKLPKEMTIESFIRKLAKYESLSKLELQELRDLLETNLQSLKILQEKNLNYVIFKNFFGVLWNESVFTKDDFYELQNYLQKVLGKEVEFWKDRDIREEFKKWQRKRYESTVYTRLKESISNMHEQQLKQVVLGLLHDPDIGFRIIELLEKQGEQS